MQATPIYKPLIGVRQSGPGISISGFDPTAQDSEIANEFLRQVISSGVTVVISVIASSLLNTSRASPTVQQYPSDQVRKKLSVNFSFQFLCTILQYLQM